MNPLNVAPKSFGEIEPLSVMFPPRAARRASSLEDQPREDGRAWLSAKWHQFDEPRSEIERLRPNRAALCKRCGGPSNCKG
jgi:hypothetical protein